MNRGSTGAVTSELPPLRARVTRVRNLLARSLGHPALSCRMRVVITGANRGIGLALARAYLEAGHDVHATARDVASATALRALASGRLVVHALDVRDEASCRALGEALGDAPIDLLVSNAGAGRDAADEPAAILAIFDTNAVGPLRVVRALGENIRAARGKIVLLTSALGSMATNTEGGAYAYRMSKAALNMAGCNLAHDFRPSGVAAVLVHPGWVRTDMGGPSAPLSAEVAASHLVALIDTLTLADSGRFYHADGTPLPW